MNWVAIGGGIGQFLLTLILGIGKALRTTRKAVVIGKPKRLQDDIDKNIEDSIK